MSQLQTSAEEKMGSPSERRRQALNDQLTDLSISDFFAIDGYFRSAQRLYDSFQKVQDLDQAYLYGKRYCKFVVESLPRHAYYSSNRYNTQKKQHNAQVDKVLKQLEQVVQKMDQQEIQREKERAKEEERKFRELQKRAQSLQNGVPSTLSTPTTILDKESLAQSALHKLQQLGGKEQPSEPAQKQPMQEDAPPRIQRDPSGEEAEGKPRSKYGIVSSSDEEELGNDQLPPPMAPPSYESIAASSTGRQNFLGPADEAEQHELPPSLFQYSQKHKRGVKRKKIPMKELQKQHYMEHVQCQHQKRILVGTIDTYQGRVSGSTNGCTVISALVAAEHLNQNSSVSDQQIANVIDKTCVPILREIRSKLGLGGHALIIPSDTHDHLVDRKILKQEYFEGAAGGNIMDPDHLGEFIKLMTVGDDGKKAHCKAAGTLFFREHVISIVKIPRSNGVSYYDFVNSLPVGNGRSMCCTRTRCVDEDALRVQLSYYASSKFNESNCTYIDKNEWDDTLADFDPRVFQGFVWHVK